MIRSYQKTNSVFNYTITITIEFNV